MGRRNINEIILKATILAYEQYAGKIKLPVVFVKIWKYFLCNLVNLCTSHALRWFVNSLQNKQTNKKKLVQVQSIYRRHIKCDSKIEKNVVGRKHCEKWRKCWLPAFSPFPTMFSKVFFPRLM